MLIVLFFKIVNDFYFLSTLSSCPSTFPLAKLSYLLFLEHIRHANVFPELGMFFCILWFSLSSSFCIKASFPRKLS